MFCFYHINFWWGTLFHNGFRFTVRTNSVEINGELNKEEYNLEKNTPKERMYYILGCTEAKALELSKEIDVPVEQCRNFLLNQVIKYLKTNSQDIYNEDLIKHGIIRAI